MKKSLLISILTFQLATSQNSNVAIGASAGGLGNSTVAYSQLWSVHNNQAGIGFLTSSEVGISYENRFGLKELGNKAIAGVYITPKGNWGLTIRSFGFKNYSENKFGLAYGRAISPKLSLGMQFNFHNILQPAGYAALNRFTIEAGMMYKFSDKLHFATHLFNPTRTKIISYSNEKMPTILKVGLAYHYSTKVVAMAEIENDIDFQTNVKVGLSYKIVERITVRGGINTFPWRNFLGVGIVFDDLYVDASASFDPKLGISPQLSINYRFSKPEDYSTPLLSPK